MRNRVERLRGWLVGTTAVLLMVLAGFLGYAHYRSRAFLAGLPGKLGMDITRETDGYTYSQTVEGRTVFTLHAAKMEQRQDGLVKLHDVGVVVYGRQQDRADRIYGKEFEYDQAAGIVRALGVVNLDLQAPASAVGKKAAAGAPVASTDARVIHVATSGLVYLTKLGVAATGEEVEFSEGSMSGRAHGADFNSDTGVVVLQSAVRVNGLTASGPMVLTASRAELDRSNQVARLAGARLVTTAETVNAGQAVVYVRKDGSPERVEGSGGVTVARAGGGVLTAERGEGTVNAGGKADGARFVGGVRFVEDDAGRQEEGRAGELVVRFDGAGLAQGVTMSGGVTMVEHGAGSRRKLDGKVVEVALGPAVGSAGGRRREVREAHAVGGGRMVVVREAAASGKGGAVTNDLAGDDLRATFAGGRRMSNLVATGHTVLHQVDAAGVEERSEGERTEMVFLPAGAANGAGGVGDLQTAVQVGHVAMVRKSPGAAAEQNGMASQRGTIAQPGAAEQRGTADRAEFDGAENRVVLTGNVVLGDAASTVWGAKVTVDRATGDASAEGGVRVTYAQAAKNSREGEPMHVLADHAVLRRGHAAEAAATPGVRGAAKVPGTGPAGAARAQDRAFFYGSAGRPARLWQGASQVEAPVLEFDQGERRLTASGPAGAGQVHAVLVGFAAGGLQSGGAQPAGPAEKSAGSRPRTGGVVRVTSREMVYAENSRDVVFTGGVLVEDADSRMRSDRATAFLQARPQGQAGGPGTAADRAAQEGAPLFGGSVERIVAAGGVEIDQPGRRGRGEQMVYTAADGMFVLTGTPAALPQVEDEARGTVTGVSLRFHRGDDSVVVTGGGIEHGSRMAGRPVRTETRVKQQ